MAFHEVRFPTAISMNSRGGPERRTEIVTLGSGAEERNQRWANSRRTYNAGYGVKSLDDIHTVIEFYEERRGSLNGFRWLDFSDWKSCAPLSTPANTDQTIGTGDGVEDTFQLVKVYGTTYSWTRTITKPVSGTVLVAVGGTPQVLGTDFTVDTTTGIITFLSGHIPGSSASITAGYEFDVPVRFDTDKLEIQLEPPSFGNIPNIPIIEIRV